MIALAKTTVSVKCVGDLKNANCYVGVIVVASNCCNDGELTVLDLSRFVNLRELKVGDECFENVNEVKLIGLSKLERVVIGMKSFTKNKSSWAKNPDRHFYLKNCERLRELKIGCYSFSDYSVCEIENVPSLEVIEMGKVDGSSYNFCYASLELKNLPSLKTLFFGDYAFENCSRVVFEDLPELTSIQFGDNAFQFFFSGESIELIMRTCLNSQHSLLQTSLVCLAVGHSTILVTSLWRTCPLSPPSLLASIMLSNTRKPSTRRVSLPPLPHS
ncbi:hypothetical protein AV274_5866 [Blastocystis sp. ATCC 50177/Nand II]|uniref:Uncharacterized protein n=1 Tax=Blastocystis sp. subtype 1 (strain ATCC 50177 / NandII) TaxID=478820 RepID=A0A196S602_BLAHN|nr:hypothetical protein AV274_5866 [Blastocystis sp. ATCC 50177/Nand II]